MNPSYFRIRLPQAEAMARLTSWVTAPEIEPPREVTMSDAVSLSCDANGHWRGSALYLYHKDRWTVFEDISGHFGSIPTESWLTFSRVNDFVYAGYNDATGYGELVVINNGTAVREFLFDSDNPELTINRGQLANSAVEPIETWVQVARFVDDDDIVFCESGLLWLHRESSY